MHPYFIIAIKNNPKEKKMKNSVKKIHVIMFVLITILLVLYLQSGYGTEQNDHDDQNTATLSVTSNDTETETVPTDIELSDSNFIVTDNRGSAELIRYENCQAFLEDFSFHDAQPFYQYFDEENGALQLTLYYDEQTGIGGGIRYYYTKQTKREAEGFVFNSADKCQHSDTFLASLQNSKQENIDCYDIYKKDFQTPDYYLYIDHNDDCMRVDFLSRHDVFADTQGRQYGIVGPSLSRSRFTETVLTQVDDTNTQLITHTYAADYDGDGKEEAFVIAGEWGNSFGDTTLQYILGELWFVDSNYTATRLDGTRTFRAWQQYMKQDGKIYLFLDHETSFSSWGTLVFSVEEYQPVIFWDYNETSVYLPEDDQPIFFPYTPCTKHINDEGQIIMILSTYDNTLDIGLGEGHYLWLGHTWKPYTFEFNHGQWKEIPAREVTREEVESIAALPETFDESAYDSVQYILRENGELNINMAQVNQEYQFIDFSNITFLLGKTQKWIVEDRDNNGIYSIQLSGESHWDYLDNLLAEIQLE